MKLDNKMHSAFWGFIVGDALGVPYEFSSREKMNQNPAIGMIGFGTHKQPPGTWSDDTSMLLCVIENLSKGGSVTDLAELFIRWKKDGYQTPHGKVFDIGITTSESIARLLAGIQPHESGSDDEYSAGNGTLMRCLPYAFTDDFTDAMSQMMLENFITHRLSICNECCLLFTGMIKSLANGDDKLQAFENGKKNLEKYWNIPEFEKVGKVNRGKFSNLFSTDFISTPENQIKSSGYVIETLEAVVWCFFNTDNYREAVLKAVNLGNDTDTIAALTGSLAALHYGYENIPSEWIEQIARKNYIESFLNNCIL